MIQSLVNNAYKIESVYPVIVKPLFLERLKKIFKSYFTLSDKYTFKFWKKLSNKNSPLLQSYKTPRA